MNIVGRLILTILTALVGVICGGLVDSYGLFLSASLSIGCGMQDLETISEEEPGH